MLFEFLKYIFPRKTARGSAAEAVQLKLFADRLLHQGDFRGAIPAYQTYLAAVPDDVMALNDLGCCHSMVGDEEAAAASFDRAFALDDTCIPVVINHAKSFSDRQKSEEAIPLLRHAKACSPDYHAADAVLASIALSHGDTPEACRLARRAWLASFDNLRLANCYLLYTAYSDVDESVMAAEHAFWASTLLPSFGVSKQGVELDEEYRCAEKAGKVRIGLWSPDFRTHSVRYFILPFLKSYDREKYEVFVYHDHPKSDEMTQKAEGFSDRFFRVSHFRDQELMGLMASHDLDVLVELSGHTSNNRINLLKNRIAPLQLSGIGYPPTTGLREVDGKIMDRHTVGASPGRFYAENPVILDESFWCFDPFEEPHIDPRPPAARNGYVTFACVGNVAKINDRMLSCWRRILDRVASSRLLLRSISFNDPASVDAVRGRMGALGFDLERIEFAPPQQASDYFLSYNQIDIVLDTFPFNGGTTTCFATYMGVPVVTMAGSSLISRMGLSIMTNLGLAEWIATTSDEYVEIAVAAAGRLSDLEDFRKTARQRYQQSALGNSERFARDFEAKILELLGRTAEAQRVHEKGSCLPVEELLRRAHFVLRAGQRDAAQRIVDYCLEMYPRSGVAQVLKTLPMTEEGNFAGAIDHLRSVVLDCEEADRHTVMLNIARLSLVADRPVAARDVLDQVDTSALADPVERCQYDLMRSVCAYADASKPEQHTLAEPEHGPAVLQVLVVSDRDADLSEVQADVLGNCHIPNGIAVRFDRIDEGGRGLSWRLALLESSADILIVMHRHIRVVSPDFLRNVLGALKHADIVGFAGAKCWRSLDWRSSAVGNKGGSFIAPSREVAGKHDLQVLGVERQRFLPGAEVLDGSLLALNRAAIVAHEELLDFDPLMEGGAVLLEEDFSRRASMAGCRLVIDQALGVSVDWRVELSAPYLFDVRGLLAERYGFDVLASDEVDGSLISVPVPSCSVGELVQRNYFQMT